MLGLKFRRQQVIDGFIVDFYCAEHGLVIEVDGGVHDDAAVAAYDRERALVLKCRSLKLLRVKNEEVSRPHLEAMIRSVLPEPPSPSGRGGRG